MTSSCRN